MIKVKFYHTNNEYLVEQGYSRKDEERIYDEQIEDILLNTRWYLDNLDFMRSYRLSWKCYPSKNKLKCSPTPRFKFVNNTTSL